jgi:hypothetical protein
MKVNACTHFIWNPNNNGTEIYPVDDSDDRDDYDDNDKRQVSSFGFNGSCIMKTGKVAKSDAKFYKGFDQKQIFCGIIELIGKEGKSYY